MKAYPKQKIESNNKLLFFVNKYKEKIINALADEVELDPGYENLWKEGLLKSDVVIMKPRNPDSMYNGVIKIEDYDEMNSIYLSINPFANRPLNAENGSIDINGIRIYFVHL